MYVTKVVFLNAYRLRASLADAIFHSFKSFTKNLECLYELNKFPPHLVADNFQRKYSRFRNPSLYFFVNSNVVSPYVSFTEKCQRLRISRTVELVEQTKIVLGEEKSKLLFLTGLNLVPKINAGTDLCSPLHCNVRSLILNVTMQLS
jgi:hypothetical protein